jgi:hypothetical protein
MVTVALRKSMCVLDADRVLAYITLHYKALEVSMHRLAKDGRTLSFDCSSVKELAASLV